MRFLHHLTASSSSSEVGRHRTVFTHEAISYVTRHSRAADKTLVIRDSASLQTWRQQLRTMTWTRNLPAVMFQLPDLSFERNRSMSALAKSYQKACGCTSGSFFMSATIVGIVVSYFVSGSHLADINLTHVVFRLGIIVLATLFGKFLGLLWARWRLLRLATACTTRSSELLVSSSLGGG